MRRGTIFVGSQPGDTGKPRPWLVVQSDLLGQASSVVSVPMTSYRNDATPWRIRVEPTQANGLSDASDIMVDKISTVSRARCGPEIGHLEDDTMLRVDSALAVVLGLA